FGRKAELLAPGDATWQPLPAGAGALAKGSAVRLGPGTTAKLAAGATTLDLAARARGKLDDQLRVALGRGGGTAPATAPASAALPGGSVALAGSPKATAEAKLDASGRDTRVTLLRGTGTLTGAPGTELAMSRGETAALARAGTIHVIEAIP